MCINQGWTEGKGLGKNEDGQKTFVKTARRPENEGIGVETDLVGDKHFNKTMTDFDKLLASLNNSNDDDAKKKKKKLKKKKKACTAATKAHQSRIRSKNVRAYSKQDLSVILGGVPVKAETKLHKKKSGLGDRKKGKKRKKETGSAATGKKSKGKKRKRKRKRDAEK